MFGFVNIIQRWLFTLFIVFGIYNPSGISYLHWLFDAETNLTIASVVGVALFGVILFIMRSTWRSMKFVGIFITALFFLLFNVMLIDTGIVSLSHAKVFEIMGLFTVASTLAIGLSFSAIRARLSGQVDSDDVGR